jgi:hypothetical protein
MKILFLDIDGVLNSRKYFLKIKNILLKDHQIDPQAVALLNQITDATGAFIVLSSTWRYAYINNIAGLRDFLSKQGVTGKVLDITPVNNDSRQNQIQEWLDTTARDIDSFVVLDDNDLGGKKLNSFLVLTSPLLGLQDADVVAAIRILNK